MSTNSIVVGTTRSGLTIAASWSCRGSGIGTTPALGSIVQKGKFCASIPAFVNALKSVDLPTLGRPTIPHLKPMVWILVWKSYIWLEITLCEHEVDFVLALGRLSVRFRYSVLL